MNLKIALKSFLDLIWRMIKILKSLWSSLMDALLVMPLRDTALIKLNKINGLKKMCILKKN